MNHSGAFGILLLPTLKRTRCTSLLFIFKTVMVEIEKLFDRERRNTSQSRRPRWRHLPLFGTQIACGGMNRVRSVLDRAKFLRQHANREAGDDHTHVGMLESEETLVGTRTCHNSLKCGVSTGRMSRIDLNIFGKIFKRK